MFGIKPENMHAATIDEILDSYKAPDGSTILAGPTSFSSYLGTHISQSFHDYTLVGRALEEREIQKKEKEAGHYDPIYNAALGGDSQISYNSGEIKHRFAMPEDEWKKSQWYRKGIEYTNNMTPERAQILAENFDERRFRDDLIQAGDQAYGVGGKILGFGAMMLGGLPDPINFIPFSGGMFSAKAAAQTAMRAGKSAYAAGIKSGLAAGAIEGGLGGAFSSLITMPDLKAKGEDIGFADALYSIGISAALGSAIGGFGGAWSTSREIRQANIRRAEAEAYLESDIGKSTESIRLQHQDIIARAYLEANPGANPNTVKEWAIAQAALFDKRAHSWAAETGAAPMDYYRRYSPEWRGAQDLEDAIRQTWGSLDNDWLSSFDAIGPEVVPPEPIAPSEPRRKPRKKTQQEAAPPVEEEPIPEIAPISPEERGPVFQEQDRPGIRGRDEKLATSQGDEDIHFEVRELDELIPSHDPLSQFQRRQDYPPNIQERPYHSDSGEQDKVRRNAVNLDPRYLINDNPDASTGAPIVTRGGIVLGGNSRTMSMQLASSSFPERTKLYREALMQNAERFGIDPAQIEQMKNPVLVRVNAKEMSMREMAQASRRYNETTTQALQVEAEGVSKAKLISQDTLSHLNEQLSAGSFSTLRDFLSDSSSKGFVQRLIRDGVIEQNQVSRVVDTDGFLKPGGKELVENALRGIIIPSYDVIKNVPTAIINKIDRAIPHLAQLKGAGEWDVSKAVIEALTIILRAKKKFKDDKLQTALWHYLHPNELTGMEVPTHSPAAQALASTLVNATPKEVSLRFAQMAEDSAINARLGRETSMLGGVQVSLGPAESFIRSFLKPVASTDGVLVHDFNPGKKIDHAALEFISKEGSTEKAIDKLNARKKDVNISPEELGKVNDLMGAVGRVGGGKHQIFDVRLDGLEGLQFNPQDRLWQDTLYSSYRARETNLGNFVQRVKSEPNGSKQSYFVLPLDGENKDVEFHILNEAIRHQGNRHPSMSLSDYNNLEIIIKNFKDDNTKFLATNGQYGVRFIGTQDIGEKHYGYVFDINKKGIVRLVTFFHDNKKNIEQWIIDAQKKASKVHFVSGQGKSSGASAFPLGKPSFNNLREATKFVKQIDAEHFNQESFGADPRGSVTFYPNGKTVIDIFRSADASTGMHELFHVFRRDIEEMAGLVDSSPISKQRWKDVCDFVGAEVGAKWTREQEEKFALAGERYLAEGIAPTPTLRTVFEKMKAWLLDLYHTIVDAGVEISPKMREVFDSMFNGDLPRNGLNDAIRGGIAPMPKHDIFRAMEKALHDFSNGDPVDVGAILRESEALSSVRDLAERYGTQEELAGRRQEAPNFETDHLQDYPEAPPLLSEEQQSAHDLSDETALRQEISDGIEQARQEGLLTEEDQRELLQNRSETERALEFDELGQSALECVWNAAV